MTAGFHGNSATSGMAIAAIRDLSALRPDSNQNTLASGNHQCTRQAAKKHSHSVSVLHKVLSRSTTSGRECAIFEGDVSVSVMPENANRKSDVTQGYTFTRTMTARFFPASLARRNAASQRLIR